MDAEATAQALKEEGNQLFRSQNYLEALMKYLQVMQIDSPGLTELKHTALLNMAACHLALHQYQSAADQCSRALTFKEHFKAYYRRAVAHLHLNELERAKADLDVANAMCPGNSAIEREYLTYLNKLKALCPEQFPVVELDLNAEEISIQEREE